MPSTAHNTTPGPITPILATRDQLAKRYAVSVRTIDEWRTEEVIPHIRYSTRLIRFDIKECDTAIQQMTHPIRPAS